MPIKGRAKLLDKEGLTSSIMRYHFEMVDPSEMNYLPGQHIEIDIGGGEKRKYSIATSPLKINTKFHIAADLSPQGRGSKYLEQLSINDEISFEGEIGDFGLPEILMPNLVFIGAGSGMAPLKCMVDSIILNREDFDVNLYVYNWAKNTDQIVWPELFISYLSDKHIDDYTVFLNDPDNTSAFVEKAGIGELNTRIPDNVVQDSQFFVCGGEEMVDYILSLYSQKGVSKDQMFYEKHY